VPGIETTFLEGLLLAAERWGDLIVLLRHQLEFMEDVDERAKLARRLDEMQAQLAEQE